LWIITGASSAKVMQIKANQKVEFCLYSQREGKDCYVRVAGKANIIEDKDIKEKLANNCDFFGNCWKSADDPGYALIEICSIEIEYLMPGESQVRRI
jgi:general stress protein 26